jgi:hypothetical protein
MPPFVGLTADSSNFIFARPRSQKLSNIDIIYATGTRRLHSRPTAYLGYLADDVGLSVNKSAELHDELMIKRDLLIDR